MAKRKSIFRKKQPVTSLNIPRTDAESKIYDRVTSGNKLLGLSIHNEKDLEAAKAQRKKWNDHNEELLRRLFSSEVVLEDYNRSSMLDSSVMKASWANKISNFYDGISNNIEALESIIKRLEFIPEKIIKSETQEKIKHRISDTISVVHGEDDETNKSTTEKPEFIPEKVIISKTQERYEPETSDTVFVVHGHDEESKVSVVRFIKKLGLKAVILHEQTNAGQNIIETFERNAAISGYAVVILTPDDTVALKEHPDDATLRERQNVIFGLGYFCGALGKANVSVLVKEGTEILCDDLGVAYTLMDPEGTWQLSLARDMKSAGLSFDANRIF